MPILQVIVLAVVQGLTEFLPISSTAHLYLTSWLLGWQIEGLDFDIALHIGTLLAVAIFFARDWVQIIAQGFGIETECVAEERIACLVEAPRVANGALEFALAGEAGKIDSPRERDKGWLQRSADLRRLRAANARPASAVAAREHVLEAFDAVA